MAKHNNIIIFYDIFYLGAIWSAAKKSDPWSSPQNIPFLEAILYILIFLVKSS